MKTRKFQIITICMLLLLTALYVPASYSKYSTNHNFIFNVKMIPDSYSMIFYTTHTTTISGTYSTETAAPAVETKSIDRTGYYAIVAKGGNGGYGYKVNNYNTTRTVAGGTGGTMAGIFYLKEGDLVTMYPGGLGARAITQTSGIFVYGYPGFGGKNAESRFNGGKGGEDSGGVMASWLSSAVAGSGGGAATSIYVTPSGTSSKTLVMIAGGGGGGASWDEGSAVKKFVSNSDSSKGGNGGTNLTDKSTPVSSQSDSSNTGKVYSGTNGGGYSDSSCHAFGYGASTSAGAGGVLPEEKIKPVFVTYTIQKLPGDPGKSFNGNGTGGDADQFGGGGGGGYCGGGGGTGSTINKADGGGGGGSSYIINTFNGKSVDATSLKTADVDGIIAKTDNNLPSQNSANGNYGDGYVIIEYLHA